MYTKYFFLFLGTRTRQKKFIHGLRKTPKLDSSTKSKTLLNLGVVQSTVSNKKNILPIAIASTTSNSMSSLVSADYESSSD